MIKMDEQIAEIICKRIKQVLKQKDLEFIQNYSCMMPKKLVYTSFDGDYMHYLYNMQEFVLSQGLIPINPEAALGYYVSTSTQGSKKIPVMIDCITAEILCDYMWIFNPKTGHVPEGVLAEMMIWERKKTEDIIIYDFFPEEISPIDKSENIRFSRLNSKYIKEYIESQWSKDELEEINNGLIMQYEHQNISSSYIIANFYNYKHIDWARRYCYLHHTCPICVQTLLPFYLYNKIFNGDYNIYLKDRLTILNKLDSTLIFVNTKRIEDEICRLDYFSMCELYFLLKYKKNVDIEMVGWDEAGVPKYHDSLQWALTTKETKEVI